MSRRACIWEECWEEGEEGEEGEEEESMEEREDRIRMLHEALQRLPQCMSQLKLIYCEAAPGSSRSSAVQETGKVAGDGGGGAGGGGARRSLLRRRRRQRRRRRN